MGDGVITIQPLILSLYLRRGVDRLAQFGDLPLLIGDLLARRGDLHIYLAQLELHALVNGIARDTAFRDRSLIAASHSVSLDLLTLPEIFELAPGSHHIRVFVGKAQQQLIEARLRLADGGRGVDRPARPAPRAHRRHFAGKLPLQLVPLLLRYRKVETVPVERV